MENILPLLKQLAFNFEYLLVIIILLLGIYVYKFKASVLSNFINLVGFFLKTNFEKLLTLKTWKILIIIFAINFVVRFFMAWPVAEISSFDKISPEYLNLARSLFNGQGLTTNVVWNNFLEPATIVRPDFFRFPLYPLLIAAFYKIFGMSFLAAKMVNVIFGALLPLATFWLAETITKSKKISLLSALVISCNQNFLVWGALTYPEIVYGCCGLLFINFLFKTDSPDGINKIKKKFMPFLVGIFWALSYLTRSEAFYIFLPVFIFYYFSGPHFKKFLIKTCITFIGFLIIAWPHLARNYILTGNPLYTDFPQVALVSYVEHDYLIESPRSEYRDIFQVLQEKPIFFVRRLSNYILDGIINSPEMLMKSYLFFILALIGLFYYFKEQRKKFYSLALLFLFGFVIPGIVSVTDRYYIILIALLFIMSVYGLKKIWNGLLYNKLKIKNLIIIYLTIYILASGALGAVNGSIALTPHNFYARFDEKQYFDNLKKVYDYLRDNAPPGEAVMVSRRPYEIYYFTNHPTVIFPFTDEKGIQEFMEKYQIKWIIWLGVPIVEGNKFLVFWPDGKHPTNISLIYKNSAAGLYHVDYY